jgi:cyclophilin family peptidyl-prolyl cis-trans isomerase
MQKRLLAAAVLCCCTAVMMMTACEKKHVVLDPDVMEQNAVDFGEGGSLNYTMPEKGEEIVVMTIENYGDVKIRLFPEQSPKGVENFTKLVREGYYDELIFHRVIDGFMIQGGDPKGNGTGGIDAWGSSVGFEQTLSPRLNHVTGAVSYAVGQDKMNKSQFFIVTGTIPEAEYFSQLNAMGYTFTPQIQSLYEAVGGTPHLDGQHEIFGQVFDGMEYVLDIQKVPTDGDDKPKSAVRIEKAVVTQYDGAAPHWLNAEGGAITGDSAGLQDEG